MKAVVYLNRDWPPRRQREFRLCAMDVRDQYTGTSVRVYPAWSGDDLIRIAADLPEPADQLILICHGSPTGFLHPGRAWGVHRWKNSPPDLISVTDFADVWHHVLLTSESDGRPVIPLISLCSCLCSRSPHWYLTRLYGRWLSPWGAESYRDGGRYSVAGTLRDAMLRRGISVRVRGHTAAGHVLSLPLLREHGPIVGDIGRSLFRIALPDVEPTWSARRRWIRLVRGSLASRWVLGDDTVVDEIRHQWPR